MAKAIVGVGSIGLQEGNASIGAKTDINGNITGNIGLQEGNASIGASVNSAGNIGVGAGVGSNIADIKGVGNARANVGASAGINTETGQIGPGVSAGVGVQGKDAGASISTGYGATGATVSPRIRIGSTPGAVQGSNIGGTVGGVAGSVFGPVGGAIGSTVGSVTGSLVGGAFGHASPASKETDGRKVALKGYGQLGIFDDGKLTNPDGSSFDMKNQIIGGGDRPFTNTNRISDTHKDRKGLFNYDIDYTNDMDYVSGMAGTTFARITGGGTSKSIDQLGGAFGNAFLGKVGTGNKLTKENFDTSMTNARAQYSKAGIKTKEDMLSLANQLYSQGRINDFDYGVTNQTASMLFDDNFNLAQTLMSGRDQGISTAGKTSSGALAGQSGKSSSGTLSGPGGIGINRPFKNGVFSPYLSNEEIDASLEPLLAKYRSAAAKQIRAGGRNRAIQGITTGIIAAKGIDKITGGAITGAIKDGAASVREWLGGDAAPTLDSKGKVIDTQLPDFSTDLTSPEVAPIDTSDGYDLGATGELTLTDGYDLGAGELTL